MKVLITPRSFGKNDNAPFELLKQHGVEIIPNPAGSIMTEPQMIEAIAGCDGVIIGVDPLNKNVLEAAPRLKAVAKYGVGVDNIDVDYCKQHGVAVSKTVGANSAAVADYAFALILSLARKVQVIDKNCRRGDWTKLTTSDVSGKKLGLIGLGAIGKQMVQRANGFNMEILAFDVFWDDGYAAREGIVKADVDEICRTCDFVSLHLPLLPETRQIIGAAQLSSMKTTAYIINTARGGLIDDDALLTALKTGSIAGAGLDAFEQEPPENKEWFGMDNVIIGSHCAASTTGAADAMGRMAAENLLRDLGLSITI